MTKLSFKQNRKLKYTFRKTVYYIHTETFIILAAFYFKSFKNAKITATHLPQNDNENEVSAFNF